MIEWISVKDRLPDIFLADSGDKESIILLVKDNNGTWGAAYYSQGKDAWWFPDGPCCACNCGFYEKGEFNSQYGKTQSIEVTHWAIVE